MPHVVVCMRPACRNLVLNLEEAAALERYVYSEKKGVPRRQTLDDYLCPDCNAQLNEWLGVNEKGQLLDGETGPAQLLERYNHARGEERDQTQQTAPTMRDMPEGVRGDQGGS